MNGWEVLALLIICITIISIVSIIAYAAWSLLTSENVLKYFRE